MRKRKVIVLNADVGGVSVVWNYSFMIPNLLVMGTLLWFFFDRRRLPIRINATFLAVLGVQLAVLIFDIAASKADEEYAQYSKWVLYALNAGFFAFYLARIYIFYLFTLDMLGAHARPRLTWALAIPFIASELICLSSPFTGWMFSITDAGYHRGPLYDLLYVCFGFYLLLSLYLLISNARKLHPNMLKGGIACNVILIAGNVIRRLLPQYLVMDTFCIIAILVIYLSFVNPDLYLSDRGPAFSIQGFRLLLKEMLLKREYCIFAFAMKNYAQERSVLGGEQMDRVIGLICQYLRRDFPNAIPFYLRGGRFALVSGNPAAANALRQQISERFIHQWHTDKTSLYLNVCFASITSNAHLDSVDRTINNLVLALETARVRSDEDEESLNIQQIDQQVDIFRTLERSIENDSAEIFLQPIAEGRSRRIVAAEALARIRDADGQIIPPALFIPIAEKSGYINQLGEQIFEKACAFIRDHDLQKMGLGWINVNISPVQLMEKDLHRRLSQIIERYQIDPAAIHLEITEQSMVDYTYLQHQVKTLREKGFQFALDDYGSGYSNLTRVKQYPFANIKIDMEVVWDYYRDRDKLLPTIMEAFHDMGFSITAEGIEDEDMARALTEIGSDYLQGYLFSKPVPAEEFCRLIRV